MIQVVWKLADTGCYFTDPENAVKTVRVTWSKYPGVKITHLKPANTTGNHQVIVEGLYDDKSRSLRMVISRIEILEKFTHL